MNFFNVALQDKNGEPSGKRLIAAAIVGYSLFLITLESLKFIEVSANAYDLLKILGSAALASVASEWFSPAYRPNYSEIP